jgi:hypothetical protein
MAEGAPQYVPPFKRVIHGSVWHTLYVGLPLCLAPRIRQFDDLKMLHLVLSSALFEAFGTPDLGRRWRRDNPSRFDVLRVGAEPAELTLTRIRHA